MFRFKTIAARAALAGLAAILLLPAAGIAQMTRGSIAGTARDASGAVVPGATVTVLNVGTNAAQTVVTDAQGYRVGARTRSIYRHHGAVRFQEGGATRRRRASGARDTA